MAARTGGSRVGLNERRMIGLLRLRGRDPSGSGAYGASRISHIHEGEDFEGYPGQPVCCLWSGKVTKIGYPKRNNWYYRYIEITYRKNKRYRFRYHYVSPHVELGQEVNHMEVIGLLQDVTQSYKYKNPENKVHLHFEIWKDDQHVDPKLYIPRRFVLPAG